MSSICIRAARSFAVERHQGLHLDPNLASNLAHHAGDAQRSASNSVGPATHRAAAQTGDIQGDDQSYYADNHHPEQGSAVALSVTERRRGIHAPEARATFSSNMGLVRGTHCGLDSGSPGPGGPQEPIQLQRNTNMDEALRLVRSAALTEAATAAAEVY